MDEHAEAPGAVAPTGEVMQPDAQASEASRLAGDERFPDPPVDRFPNRLRGEVLVPPTAGMQLSEEVEMTPLVHPAVSSGEPLRAPKSVGDEGADLRGYGERERAHRRVPILRAFSPRQEDRVEKHRPGGSQRLDGHQVERPDPFAKPEPHPVDNQDLLARGNRPARRVLQPPRQGPAEALAQARNRQPGWTHLTHQRALLAQGPAQQRRGDAPRLASGLLATNPPRASALTTPPPSTTKALNPLPTAGRLLMSRAHARELSPRTGHNSDLFEGLQLSSSTRFRYPSHIWH
jgi:hypothetical protein